MQGGQAPPASPRSDSTALLYMTLVLQVMDSDGVLLKSMAGADEARLKQLLADALSSKKVN